MIGIVTAIKEEYNAIKRLMVNQIDRHFAKMDFTVGLIGNTSVILGECGQGKVNAACCTQLIIDRFLVNTIINVGIAGGIGPEVNINDVIISDKAIQYDMDATGEGFELGEVPDFGFVEFKASPKLIRIAKNSAEVYKIAHKIGTVLSADQFVDSQEKKNEILENFEGLVCEMEGAAIAQVCYLNNVPFIIIRSVSDNATEDANELIQFNVEEAINKTTSIVESLAVNLK